MAYSNGDAVATQVPVTVRDVKVVPTSKARFGTDSGKAIEFHLNTVREDGATDLLHPVSYRSGAGLRPSRDPSASAPGLQNGVTATATA